MRCTNNPSPGGIGTTPVVTPSVIFINKLNLQTREVFSGLMPESQQVIFDYINLATNNQATVIFSLNNMNLGWVTEQSAENQISIFKYLVQNSFSVASRAFVNEMINLSISNNSTFTFDNTINSSNAQVFNNVQEFQNSIIKTGNGFDVNSTTTLNEVVSSVKFQINNIGTKLQIDIKQKLTPTYQVSNLTTQLVGLASFLNSTLTNYTVNNSPMGAIRVDVYDTVSMNITVYGYGIVVNQPYHITVLINSTNGQIISSFINP